MTKFALNLHQPGDKAKEKSGLSMLLFFALLFLMAAFGEALASSQTSGWAFAEASEQNSLDSQEQQQAQDHALETDTSEQNSEPYDDVSAVTTPSEEPLPDTDLQVDDQPDETLSEPDLSDEAELEETVTHEVVTQPVIDLDPALRNSLDLEFKRILELQESFDAFNEDLGEAYLSYGLSLQSAGRLEEARDMFANALHISKINNGVNSIEQRPMLKALFEISFAQGNIEDSEEHLKRIVWLENNNPDIRDDYSFDMMLRLGNLYIDRYLARPTASETSIANLFAAERHLEYAINRYGNQPMSKVLMPYGELALVNFLKGETHNEIRSRRVEGRRNLPASISGQDDLTLIEQERVKYAIENSFYQAEDYLIKYLTKAKEENQHEHVIQALLNLADLNLLYGRKIGASQYYQLAWEEAQQLPPEHELVLGFSRPTALPAFSYAKEREIVEGKLLALFVPLTFNLDDRGRVRGFSEDNTGEPYPDLLKRAMRAAKRMRFRPVIENGKMIAANDYTYDVKVLVRRKQSGSG